MIADIIGDTRVLENIGGPRLNMRAQRRIVSDAMRVGSATCPHDLGQLLLSIPLQAFAVGVSASTRVRSCLSYHRRAIANHMRCAVCSHLVPTTCWGPLWTDAFWRSIGAAINTRSRRDPRKRATSPSAKNACGPSNNFGNRKFKSV